MNTAVQAIQEGYQFTPNVDISFLRTAMKRGAEEVQKIMLWRFHIPDFYTVERDETEDCYTELEEVLKQIDLALVGGFVHFCVQAHYLLPVGDGEVSITLFLADE